MEFKGTKGEWKIKRGFGCYEFSIGTLPYSPIKGYGMDESLSNATLIAAAPELLEALQTVTRQYNDLLDSLYGKNIGVVGWHLNGDHEPFDTFIDDNDEGGLELAEKAINKALNN